MPNYSQLELDNARHILRYELSEQRLRLEHLQELNKSNQDQLNEWRPIIEALKIVVKQTNQLIQNEESLFDQD